MNLRSPLTTRSPAEAEAEAGGRRLPPDGMTISVVVPVRNEEASVGALLDGLLAQTRPPDEIVLTDGGSTDRTAEIIENYAAGQTPVRLVRAAAALPGRGRNLAAAAASGDWLAFIDAGIRPAADWLEELAARAREAGGAEVVYGAWEPVTDSFFKECAAIAYVQPPAEVEGGRIRPRFIASALMRRSVWSAVGGFPEHLRSAEDILFMDKVEEADFRTVHAPRAVVRWDIQPDLWRTFKRFTSYSRHNLRAGLWRQWQAAIFKRYGLILACSLPALLLGWRWWLAALCALWLLVLAARAFVAIRRNRAAYPAGPGRNLLRLLLLIPIIGALDLAAFVGTFNWLLRDRLGPRGRVGDTGGGDGA